MTTHSMTTMKNVPFAVKGLPVLQLGEVLNSENHVKWIRRVAFAMLLAFAAAPTIVSAQYISESAERLQLQTQKTSKLEDVLQGMVGSTYWYAPNPEAISRIEFFESMPTTNANYLDGEKFRPVAASQFSVTGVFFFESLSTYYLQVRFADGKTGYVEARSHGNPLNFYEGTNSSYEEYIFKEPPDIALEKERIAKAQELKKEKAKGGVRIGMTKKQVLKSNWGEPNYVNKTTTARGTDEQWVYDGPSYLYFTNGILRAAQN